MSKIKKLVYSLAVMVFAVVAFSSCDKSDYEPMIPDSVSKSTSEEGEMRANNQIAPSSSRWWWNYLLDEEYFPLSSDRWSDISVPAGSTKYVKFKVSQVGKYRILLRHSTVGVTLRMRRYRGSTYLVGKNIAGNTDTSVVVETNGNGPQGSTADGDIMKLEIENTSNTDVNDLVVNWSPFYYGNW